MKEKYYLLDSQYKSDLKKPQLKQTSANVAELKANSDISILKKLKNSFNRLNFQRNKNFEPVVISTQDKKENFLYSFDVTTMQHVQCHLYAQTMSQLTESYSLHNPPNEKIAY